MYLRIVAVAALLGTALAATSLPLHAQNGAKATSVAKPKAIPRTPDGKPNFQGTWTTATYTPFERPAALKDREYFTADEAAAYAKQQIERQLAQADDDVHYDNSIWMTERAPRGMTTLRTSIVTEPADGRMPPVNAEGKQRAEERAAARRLVGAYDSAQSRGLSERCIYWGHEGPPLLPTGYNNSLQIVQSSGQVVLIPEMMNVARIVPLDNRPHLPAALRSLRGDPRGQWDGDTLVVVTTNFTDKTAFRGSSEHLKVTERLTMVDADTIRYQFTIEDPHTWDVPWKGEYAISRTSDPMYEYACHEGNYGLANTLRAQRVAEEEARKGVTQP